MLCYVANRIVAGLYTDKPAHRLLQQSKAQVISYFPVDLV